MHYTTYDELISFAMQKEGGAAAFYQSAVAVARSPVAQVMFRELAEEERKHRRMLEGLNVKSLAAMKAEKIPDLKISDYLLDVGFEPTMNYQQVLTMAIKMEERSLRFYTGIAKRMVEPKARNLLEFLTQEEAKHKLRLETEYDKRILKED
jgi:rubrerythrin